MGIYVETGNDSTDSSAGKIKNACNVGGNFNMDYSAILVLVGDGSCRGAYSRAA